MLVLKRRFADLPFFNHESYYQWTVIATRADFTLLHNPLSYW